MDLNRLKNLKELLNQRKEILKNFYKSEDFNVILEEIKLQVENNQYVTIEGQEISTDLEVAIDSIFLIERTQVFKMHSQKIPSFHLFYGDLVFSKFYQEKVIYSVESKNDFLFKQGLASDKMLN